MRHQDQIDCGPNLPAWPDASIPFGRQPLAPVGLGMPLPPLAWPARLFRDAAIAEGAIAEGTVAEGTDGPRQ